MVTAANLDPIAFWVLWELKGRPDDMLRDLPLPILLAIPKRIFPIKEWEEYWNTDDLPEKGTPEAFEWFMSGKWQETKPVPSLDSPGFLRSGPYAFEWHHGTSDMHAAKRVGFSVYIPACDRYPETVSEGYTTGGLSKLPPTHHSELLDFEEAIEAIRYCAIQRGDL